MSYFNLGYSKNNGAGSAEEGKDYIVIKDGNGYDVKVLNLENEKYAPFTGIVEVMPVRVSKRHVNNINMKFYRDRDSGFLIGMPIGIDPQTKQINWIPINVKDKEAYDLSIPAERAKYICVKYSPFMKGSPNFRTKSSCVYVQVDKEQEARTFHTERKTKKKATEIAESLVGEELIDLALMIGGLDPNLMSPMTLWMEVVKFAEKDPKKFMEIYNSEGKSELLIVKKGLSTGVLEEVFDRGITYNGIALGFNEAEAVEYLKKNPQTAISIELQARKKNQGTQAAITSTKESKQPIKDEKDAEIERLKRELAKAQEEKLAAASVALNLQSEKDIAEADPEYAALLAEAKQLGIQGAHLTKDKEKLRKKIEDKKSSVGN